MTVNNNKPTYRLQVKIYDENTGYVVTRADTPLLSQGSDNEEHRADDNAVTYYLAMRSFGRERAKFEEDYYPKEI